MKDSQRQIEPINLVRAIRIRTDVESQQSVSADESVAVEAPVRIDLEGFGAFTVFCSPSDRRAMAAGFLCSKGIISDMNDVAMLEESADVPDLIRVRLKDKPVAIDPADRNLVVTSTSGICRSEGIEDRAASMPVVGNKLVVTPKLIRSVSRKLHESQKIFQGCGGTHAVCLFNEKGEIVSFAEDIGRHNALDKAIGKRLLSNLRATGLGAVFSGRISLEMVGKCACAGIELICAVSAPTSLALEAAAQCGITVLAFVRDTRATIYTHPERVALLPGSA